QFDAIYTELGFAKPHQEISIESTSPSEVRFEKTSKITFITEEIEGFQNIYTNLQAAVYTQFSQDNFNSSSPATLVVMGAPTTGISEKTRKKMTKMAHELATENANQLFLACAQKCAIDTKSIVVCNIDDIDRSERKYSEFADLTFSEPHPVDVNLNKISL